MDIGKQMAKTGPMTTGIMGFDLWDKMHKMDADRQKQIYPYMGINGLRQIDGQNGDD